MVQCELERVLYPVFIHCYLDLVGSRVAAGEAQKFMTENKHRFLEAGNQSSNRRQQVRDAQATRCPLTLSHTQAMWAHQQHLSLQLSWKQPLHSLACHPTLTRWSSIRCAKLSQSQDMFQMVASHWRCRDSQSHVP